MKVSVLPWLDIANYGSVLQVFAVQKVLEQYADSVEIINFKQNSRLTDNLSKNPMKLANNLLSYVFLKRNFRMVETQLNFTQKVYTSEKDFTDHVPIADIYCTSSDQIWNMKNRPSVFGARFLSFLPEDKRRFAFASSFGDRIHKDLAARSKEWIHRFEHISVREDVGIRIIEEKYDYHGAIQLVDPTLALPPDVWRSYAPELKNSREYILIYDIMDDKAFFRYAEALSIKTGLPLVHLCHRFARIFYCGRSVFIPPVFDFITLIDKAKYVLTGSFHATAFAMSLNTEPVCVYHSRNPGRIASFLRLTGAEYRAIKDYDDFDVINRRVDFAYVNSVLERERGRVDDFLSSIFIPGSGSQ